MYPLTSFAVKVERIVVSACLGLRRVELNSDPLNVDTLIEPARRPKSQKAGLCGERAYARNLTISCKSRKYGAPNHSVY